jgi:uncharacterized protein (DUF58 family)
MIPKEVLKHIRRIQISTSRMVTDVFAGQYRSVFKGRGMEFDEVREYQPGDDIRSIDWNVTARLGSPYVKKFIEEREMTVMLMVDVSRSMYYGTSSCLKKKLAAELCSVLAFSAIKNNDKVGLIVFSDTVERFIPPRKGTSHVLHIIREVLYTEAEHIGTDISGALRYLDGVCKRRSVVFLISDLYDDNIKRSLAMIRKKHDLVAITLTDRSETMLEPAGIVEFADAETGASYMVDTCDPAFRRAYEARSLELRGSRRKMLQSVNVDHIELNNEQSYIRELVRFFRMRERRR